LSSRTRAKKPTKTKNYPDKQTKTVREWPALPKGLRSPLERIGKK